MSWKTTTKRHGRCDVVLVVSDVCLRSVPSLCGETPLLVFVFLRFAFFYYYAPGVRAVAVAAGVKCPGKKYEAKRAVSRCCVVLGGHSDVCLFFFLAVSVGDSYFSPLTIPEKQTTLYSK